MAISAQELNIILSARDKEFARAMAANQRRVERFAKQSQKQLSQTSKSFDVLGAAAKRLLPAIAAGAVVAAVKDVTAAMDEIGKKADAIGIKKFLFKPLNIQDLAISIRDVLGHDVKGRTMPASTT